MSKYLYKLKSLETRVTSISTPSRNGLLPHASSSYTPPPDTPAWMLRYFPEFFTPDKGPNMDAQHSEPYGKMGLYAYLISAGTAALLGCYSIYEWAWNDESTKSLAALKEKRVRDIYEQLLKERRSELEMSAKASTDVVGDNVSVGSA